MNDYPVVKAIAGHGHLGLDLFFVISGFVIPYALYQNRYTVRQFPRFLAKRSIRIEIPYIASFCIYLIFTSVEAYTNGYKVNFEYTRFFLHFFYLQEYLGYIPYSSVYWTLAIEFQFYLLVGCLFPLIIHKNRGIQLGLFFIFGFLCWYLLLPFNLYIFQFGFLFLAGIFVFLYQVKNISIRTFLPGLGLILLMVFLKNGIESACVVMLASTAILYLKKEWSFTRFLGNISFSLYLTHISSAGLFRKYLRPVITDDILLRCISIVFAILYATLFYYAIEKPAFKLSKKINYKKKRVD